MYSSITATNPVERPGRAKILSSKAFDGFKRDSGSSGYKQPLEMVQGHGKRFNAKAAAANTANSHLARTLKNRHLQMIAIGGSIGTGLFIGSGQALAVGGPASLLIAYILIGAVLYCTVQALGEMAVLFPVSGSFSAFSTRFIDPAWGFAMGWNYGLQYLFVMPLEIMAASLTLEFWDTPIPRAVAVGVFLAAIVAINLCGVKTFGEAEFFFSVLKVAAVIGFVILGVVINCAGGQNSGYIGGQYYSNPGAFNAGFKGFCNVLVTASFSFAGTELVGLAAAETHNPAKSIPKAVKQVFWRITLFYVTSIAVIGFLVPYTSPSLISQSSFDTAASPFVIAIRDAGITGLDAVMNAVILISVLSVANSSLFGSSRTLAALASQGQAPKILAYVDRTGRPIVAIGVASASGLLAFLSVSEVRGEAFKWLLALSGLSSIFTWASICLAHVRFRSAWLAQNHTLDELVYRSPTGIIGSWIGFLALIVVLVTQLWVALDPVGTPAADAREAVENFFSAYLAAPIVLVFGIGYKLAYKTVWVRSHTADLTSGRYAHDLQAMGPGMGDRKGEREEWPLWKRVYMTMC